MGEQPGPVEDEVERALASMRAGFLSGSEQIAAGVAALEEHLADAPDEERAAVGAAVARLIATHERLTAKVSQLPPSSWDSFKILVSAVKAQQAVLDQVSHLVKEHVLPRQLENLSVTPFPAAPAQEEPPPQVEPSFLGPFHDHDDGFPSHVGYRGDDHIHGDDGFRAEDGFHSRREASFGAGPHDAGAHHAGPRHAGPHRAGARRAGARAGLRTQSEPGFRALADAGLRRADDDADDPEPRSLLTLVRERTAGFRGLAAMIVVGVILGVFPHDMKLQEIAANLVEMLAAGGNATVAEDPPPVAEAAPRSAERVPLAPDAGATPGRGGAAAGATPDPTPVAAPQRVAAATGREDSPAPAEPGPKRVAAVVPTAPPAAPPAEERFVPVVFTHRDRATALRAMSDLKQQYPNILIGRQGKVLPVDLGKKGIWHRLVVLPAGPKPEAMQVCEELAAKGYDRCWVKAY